MPFEFIAVFLACFVVSWAGSALMRRYALSRAIIDIPNARSSHSVPTPRGGGVAFVLSFIMGLVALGFLGYTHPSLILAVGLGGATVAIVGFCDDRRSVSIGTKLFWHVVASLVALTALGGWPAVTFGFLPVGWSYFAGLIVLVWATNLFNFMDGIDGLAISQSIFLALGSALIIWLANGSAMEFLLMAAACTGFAFLNWPPAKLFMGDAGSGFLGFVFATIALDSMNSLETTVWPWLILPAVFLVDATFTLLRRLLTGQPWYDAHCSHAYQLAARRFGSHKRVTVFAQILNVVWILPWGCVAQLNPENGWLCVAAVWLPLLAVAAFFGAGKSGPDVGTPGRGLPMEAGPQAWKELMR